MKTGDNSRRLKFERLETRVAPCSLFPWAILPLETGESLEEESWNSQDSIAEHLDGGTELTANQMRSFLAGNTQDLEPELQPSPRADLSELPEPARCASVDRFMEKVS